MLDKPTLRPEHLLCSSKKRDSVVVRSLDLKRTQHCNFKIKLYSIATMSKIISISKKKKNNYPKWIRLVIGEIYIVYESIHAVRVAIAQ